MSRLLWRYPSTTVTPLSRGREQGGSYPDNILGDEALYSLTIDVHPNPETQNPKPKAQNPKPETRNPKSEIRNPEPETRNLKPKTPNPKH